VVLSNLPSLVKFNPKEGDNFVQNFGILKIKIKATVEFYGTSRGYEETIL